MKLNTVGTNQTELVLSSGDTVFFSYNTPVAVVTNFGTFKTSKFWSVTTSKHINKWLDGIEAEKKDQEFFDNLVK